MGRARERQEGHQAREWKPGTGRSYQAGVVPWVNQEQDQVPPTPLWTAGTLPELASWSQPLTLWGGPSPEVQPLWAP